MKIVILAGGGGTRLYPLSTAENPKQFLPLAEGKPLIINTILRFIPIVSQNDIVVVTGAAFEQRTKRLLKEFLLEDVNVVLEPNLRNTAPAIALGVKFCKETLKVDESEPLIIVPSDHIIRPEDEYLNHIRLALDAIKDGCILTFGVKPVRPETGFGYIRAEDSNVAIRKVAEFKEKPSLDLAKRYLSDGHYFWNAGMYGFSLKTFENELRKNAKDLFDLYVKPLETFKIEFAYAEKISFDYAVAEKTNNIMMLPLNIQWSDIGSWDAYYEFCPKDENGNVLIGDVKAVDCKNCLIAGYDGSISVLNESDKVVISNGGQVLVLSMKDAQDIKRIQ